MRNPDPSKVEALRAADLTPGSARLLALRGIGVPADAERFLRGGLVDMSDPFLFSGMDRGASRLAAAVTNREKICIYGDYDVDGVTATALLVGFFRELQGDVIYHIPRRLEDGYGLSSEGVVAVSALGAHVVVTVDCGITAVDEALTCREKGMDLIITDHHLPGAELPDTAYAIINPQLPGCSFPFKGVAGVGVAFFLAVAVRSLLRRQGYFTHSPEPNLKSFLDLVALGTIADLAPVQGENRLLVRHGLKELSASRRPGIVALKDIAGVAGEVTCSAVGFRLAPRINAAGRLDYATSGVELLLTDDAVVARSLAGELDAGNRERQELEKEILADALKQLGDGTRSKKCRSIVLASADWHPGVIGIVASKIVELYHRPTILIALQDGVGKGSGRSIPPLHLKSALDNCAEHLLKFGGHRQAAGLSVQEDTLAAFVQQFEAVTQGLLTEEDLRPDVTLDMELLPSLFSREFFAELKQLAPFGIGNPEPLFLVRGARVRRRQQLKGGHLRFDLTWHDIPLQAVLFGKPDCPFEPGDTLDLAAWLQENSWRGVTTLQLRIRDLRPAGGEVVHAA